MAADSLTGASYSPSNPDETDSISTSISYSSNGGGVENKLYARLACAGGGYITQTYTLGNSATSGSKTFNWGTKGGGTCYYSYYIKRTTMTMTGPPDFDIITETITVASTGTYSFTISVSNYAPTINSATEFGDNGLIAQIAGANTLSLSTSDAEGEHGTGWIWWQDVTYGADPGRWVQLVVGSTSGTDRTYIQPSSGHIFNALPYGNQYKYNYKVIDAAGADTYYPAVDQWFQSYANIDQVNPYWYASPYIPADLWTNHGGADNRIGFDAMDSGSGFDGMTDLTDYFVTVEHQNPDASYDDPVFFYPSSVAQLDYGYFNPNSLQGLIHITGLTYNQPYHFRLTLKDAADNAIHAPGVDQWYGPWTVKDNAAPTSSGPVLMGDYPNNDALRPSTWDITIDDIGMGVDTSSVQLLYRVNGGPNWSPSGIVWDSHDEETGTFTFTLPSFTSSSGYSVDDDINVKVVATDLATNPSNPNEWINPNTYTVKDYLRPTVEFVDGPGYPYADMTPIEFETGQNNYFSFRVSDDGLGVVWPTVNLYYRFSTDGGISWIGGDTQPNLLIVTSQVNDEFCIEIMGLWTCNWDPPEWAGGVFTGLYEGYTPDNLPYDALVEYQVFAADWAAPSNVMVYNSLGLYVSDGIKPTISVVSRDSPVQHQDATIIVSALDTGGSGLNWVDIQWWLNGVDQGTEPMVNPEFDDTFSYTFLGVNMDTYLDTVTMRLTATDTEGNYIWHDDTIVWLDGEAPRFTGDISFSHWYFDGDIIVQAITSGRSVPQGYRLHIDYDVWDNVGIDTYEMIYYTSDDPGTLLYRQPTQGNFFIFSDLSNVVKYWFKLRVTDAAGHETYYPTSGYDWFMVKDDTPPNHSDIKIDGSPYSGGIGSENSDPTITIKAWDDDTHVTSVKMYWGISATASERSTGNNIYMSGPSGSDVWTATIDPIDLTQHVGRYLYLSFEIIDLANNDAGTVEGWSLILDERDPLIYHTDLPNPYPAVSGNPTINGPYADPGGNLIQYWHGSSDDIWVFLRVEDYPTGMPWGGDDPGDFMDDWTFDYSIDGGNTWIVLGIEDMEPAIDTVGNPINVMAFHIGYLTGVPPGTEMSYRATVLDSSGNTGSWQWGAVNDPTDAGAALLDVDDPDITDYMAPTGSEASPQEIALGLSVVITLDIVDDNQAGVTCGLEYWIRPFDGGTWLDYAIINMNYDGASCVGTITPKEGHNMIKYRVLVSDNVSPVPNIAQLGWYYYYYGLGGAPTTLEELNYHDSNGAISTLPVREDTDTWLSLEAYSMSNHYLVRDEFGEPEPVWTIHDDGFTYEPSGFAGGNPINNIFQLNCPASLNLDEAQTTCFKVPAYEYNHGDTVQISINVFFDDVLVQIRDTTFYSFDYTKPDIDEIVHTTNAFTSTDVVVTVTTSDDLNDSPFEGIVSRVMLYEIFDGGDLVISGTILPDSETVPAVPGEEWTFVLPSSVLIREYYLMELVLTITVTDDSYVDGLHNGNTRQLIYTYSSIGDGTPPDITSTFSDTGTGDTELSFDLTIEDSETRAGVTTTIVTTDIQFMIETAAGETVEDWSSPTSLQHDLGTYDYHFTYTPISDMILLYGHRVHYKIITEDINSNSAIYDFVYTIGDNIKPTIVLLPVDPITQYQGLDVSVLINDIGGSGVDLNDFSQSYVSIGIYGYVDFADYVPGRGEDPNHINTAANSYGVCTDLGGGVYAYPCHPGNPDKGNPGITPRELLFYDTNFIEVIGSTVTFSWTRSGAAQGGYAFNPLKWGAGTEIYAYFVVRDAENNEVTFIQYLTTIIDNIKPELTKEFVTNSVTGSDVVFSNTESIKFNLEVKDYDSNAVHAELWYRVLPFRFYEDLWGGYIAVPFDQVLYDGGVIRLVHYETLEYGAQLQWYIKVWDDALPTSNTANLGGSIISISVDNNPPNAASIELSVAGNHAPTTFTLQVEDDSNGYDYGYVDYKIYSSQATYVPGYIDLDPGSGSTFTIYPGHWESGWKDLGRITFGTNTLITDATYANLIHWIVVDAIPRTAFSGWGTNYNTYRYTITLFDVDENSIVYPENSFTIEDRLIPTQLYELTSNYGGNIESTVTNFGVDASDSVWGGQPMSDVSFRYRVDLGSWNSIQPTILGGGVGNWEMHTQVGIPAQPAGSLVEYEWRATDGNVNLLISPGSYTVHDLISPLIELVTQDVIGNEASATTVTVDAYDSDTSISEVTLYYKVNHTEEWIGILMTPTTGISYSGDIPQFNYSDYVEWKVEATDLAGNIGSIYGSYLVTDEGISSIDISTHKQDVGETYQYMVGSTEIYIPYLRSYTDPVVIVTPVISTNRVENMTQYPIVTNITTNGAFIKQVGDGSVNDNGTYPALVNVFVVEKGRYRIGDAIIEVGSQIVSNGQTVNLVTSYSQNPIVLASAQMVDRQIRARVINTGLTSFDVVLEENETVSLGSHEVGYVVFDSSPDYEAGSITIDSVLSEQTHSTIDALLFATLASNNEVGGYAVAGNMTNTQYNITIEETNILDGLHVSESVFVVLLTEGLFSVDIIEGSDTIVKTDILDSSELISVTMRYKIGAGTWSDPEVMILSSNEYFASIPASGSNEIITVEVTVVDNAGNTGTSSIQFRGL